METETPGPYPQSPTIVAFPKANVLSSHPYIVFPKIHLNIVLLSTLKHSEPPMSYPYLPCTIYVPNILIPLLDFSINLWFRVWNIMQFSPSFLYRLPIRKKQSRNSPGVTQRVPGGLGSQIS